MPKTKLVAVVAALLAAAAARGGTIGTPITADGYVFTNFDFPNSGTAAGAGTNVNGIANNGNVVGFSLTNNGDFDNFAGNPYGAPSAVTGLALTAMALGINSAGDVVGQNNAGAFFQAAGGSPMALLTAASTSIAFGINDDGNIVGQFMVGNESPGFYLADSEANSLIEILAPGAANIVNAQGIDDNGLIVGFYVGNDGQDHGFEANVKNASGGLLVGSAIGDPTIPGVAGEPGATFVFSQILGVNDHGIAVGYYGDSTTSQHGFLYNTNTGVYTFLDDPAEQFSNGVEVTQITGINKAGEITGFYTDANGVSHGFVGCPAGENCANLSAAQTPEPASWMLGGLGLGLAGLCRRRRAVRSA